MPARKTNKMIKLPQFKYPIPRDGASGSTLSGFLRMLLLNTWKPSSCWCKSVFKKYKFDRFFWIIFTEFYTNNYLWILIDIQTICNDKRGSNWLVNSHSFFPISKSIKGVLFLLNSYIFNYKFSNLIIMYLDFILITT